MKTVLLTVEEIQTLAAAKERLLGDIVGYSLMVDLGDPYGVTQSDKINSALRRANRRLRDHDLAVQQIRNREEP